MYIKTFIDNYPSEHFLKLDGFDDALIGVEECSMRLIYSISKCIEILMEHMDYHDAVDYFYNNIKDKHDNQKSPIWCSSIF